MSHYTVACLDYGRHHGWPTTAPCSRAFAAAVAGLPEPAFGRR